MARLEELEDPWQRRKGQARLKASFNYSLRALRAGDQAAYEAFVGLGLLPEDAAIAAPMAATLWAVEEAEADVLLEILWSESLLLPGRQSGSTSGPCVHIVSMTSCTTSPVAC